MTPDPLEAFLDDARGRIESTLEHELRPATTRPSRIHEAMRYAVLGGGKRLRPILGIAAASAAGSDVEPLLTPICALELIHTYSLVHDDLPSLDDDDLRRGRETTHVVFGEAVGVLTGDALLTEAFVWLSRPISGIAGEVQLAALRLVAEAVDSTGMIGGQVADLEAERMHEGEASHDELLDTLSFIHRNKTGRLLTASVMLGGTLAGAGPATLRHLERYGGAVGLAFQIVDDLLDLEESAATLGKTAGKDLEQGKLTWPAVVGRDAARAQVDQLLAEAVDAADMIGGSRNYLGPLARLICARRS